MITLILCLLVLIFCVFVFFHGLFLFYACVDIHEQRNTWRDISGHCCYVVIFHVLKVEESWCYGENVDYQERKLSSTLPSLALSTLHSLLRVCRTPFKNVVHLLGFRMDPILWEKGKTDSFCRQAGWGVCPKHVEMFITSLCTRWSKDQKSGWFRTPLHSINICRYGVRNPAR